MAGEAGIVESSVEEPIVVELDSITDTVDLNDAITDDNGNVIQYLDREKNTTYKLKGSVNPLESETVRAAKEAAKTTKDATDKAAKEVADAAALLESGKAKPGTPAKVEPPKPDETKYSNQAEYVLRKAGYKHDEVDFGGDVGKVKIADLTAEQQVEIISAEFETATKGAEDKIKELEARAPELKFDDPSAQQIVDYLKNGGDIKKLAKEILSRDPAAQSKMLSDEEIVKMSIKKEYDDFTPEEVEAELKEMTPEKIARRAKALRSKMEKEKPDFTSLTDEQKAVQAQEKKQQDDDFALEVTGVKEAAKKLEKIAGLPLNDEIRSFLVSKVVPANSNEDSDFIKSINSPEALLELQFWKEYGNKMLERSAKYYYEKGLKAQLEGTEKLSDEPIKTYGSRSEKKGGKNAVRTMDTISMDEFLNGGKF